MENSSVTVAGSMQYLKAVVPIPGSPGGFEKQLYLDIKNIF